MNIIKYYKQTGPAVVDEMRMRVTASNSVRKADDHMARRGYRRDLNGLLRDMRDEIVATKPTKFAEAMQSAITEGASNG